MNSNYLSLLESNFPIMQSLAVTQIIMKFLIVHIKNCFSWLIFLLIFHIHDSKAHTVVHFINFKIENSLRFYYAVSENVRILLSTNMSYFRATQLNFVGVVAFSVYPIACLVFLFLHFFIELLDFFVFQLALNYQPFYCIYFLLFLFYLEIFLMNFIKINLLKFFHINILWAFWAFHSSISFFVDNLLHTFLAISMITTTNNYWCSWSIIV